MKRLAVFAFAAVILVPLETQAQVSPGNTNLNCSLADLVNVTVTKCSGFWSGNLLNRNAGQLTDADETAGLTALGFGQVTVIEKIDALGGSAFVNFATALSGPTAIAIHWGNSPFPNGYNGQGGGTSFYLFDGTGKDQINFSAQFSQGSSGATLYKTGTVVPEPSTYALIAAGLAALGIVARRRRSA